MTRLLAWIGHGLLASLATALFAAAVYRGGARSDEAFVDAASVSLLLGVVPWCLAMVGWGALLAVVQRLRGRPGVPPAAGWTLLPVLGACALLLVWHEGDALRTFPLAAVASLAVAAALAWAGRRVPAPPPRLVGALAVGALGLHLGAAVHLAREGWLHFPDARLPAGPEAGASASEGADPERPNIVLVVMDTTRADHLSLYGHERATTPNLERIARRSVVFDDATAPAIWTLPTHASMFTGLYESEHGVNRGHLWLEDRFDTLAEQLREAGYRTVGATGNPLLLPGFRNLDQGFEAMLSSESLHVPTAMADPGTRRPWWRERALALAENVRHREMRASLLAELFRYRVLPGATAWNRGRQDAGAAVSNALVEDFLARRDPERPFLLFLNYFEPHTVYNPPPRHRERFLTGELRRIGEADYRRTWTGDSREGHTNFRARALGFRDPAPTPEEIEAWRRLYDAEIAYLDERIGELYDLLDRRGLLDDTVLVITADHGEQFLDEHGLVLHEFSIYESLLRVPLLVHHPSRFEPRRVETPVQTIDLYRTLLWLADVEPSRAQPLRGQILPLEPGIDYTPRVVAEYSVPDFPVFTLQRDFRSVDLRPFFRTFRAWREDGWKFIWSSDGDHELYHLPDDPGEQRDRIDEEPERAARMEAALEAWRAGLEPFELDPDAEELPMDPERDRKALEQLRALGYAQ
ncbi:MAG: sulfatase-like hydrolase/transferase [Myxococcota bacterium]|nr:sulfatase-like hydrolase/transferase [Myxococcota bacterium]